MKSNKAKYFLALISLGLVYGTMFNLPYMKYIFYDAMLEGMGCTNTQLGLLVTVYTVISCIGLIPGGWIADRYQTKSIIVWSAAVQGVATIAFIFYMNNYAMAMVTWIIAGVCGVTAFWAAIFKAVSMVGGKDEQGRTYGYYEGFCGVSATITNAIALFVFSRFDSSVVALKWALAVMGVMNLVGALLVQAFFDPRTTEVHYTEAAKHKATIKETMHVFLIPKFYLSCVIIFCAYGFYTCQSFITPYFTNVLGATVTFAGVLAIIKQYALKFVGGPIGGVFADKLKSVSKMQIIVMLVMFVLIVVVANLTGGGNLVTLLTVLTLVLATLCFMSRATMWATIDEAGVPKEISGTAIAVASIIGFNIPDLILPTLIGSWLDKYGNAAYGRVFTLLCTLCAVGVIASATLVYTNKLSARKAAAKTAESA